MYTNLDIIIDLLSIVLQSVVILSFGIGIVVLIEYLYEKKK
tara:strand:+ start:2124 stop:2246 length:123 start_codon:yes stop_codon:yes gene_type:complete